MKNILVIDDDLRIGNVLEETLTNEGYGVIRAYSGTEAVLLLSQVKPDLVLLDLMLPGLSGEEVLPHIKGIPVIIMSAKVDVDNKVALLLGGAVDYMTKPFNPLEVIARVKTQLRRYQKYNNPTKKQFFPKSEYDIRGLIINKDTHKCFLFGKEISLTPIEFSILWYLCEHQGKVVSTEELFENIWKEKYLDNNNTVMAHIGRLREKLNEPAKNPKFIKTVWGVGYEIE